MKIKKINPMVVLVIAVANLSIGSLSAFAQGGSSGLRGGGEVMDISGRPTLRDLVDSTNCFWYKGNNFISESGPASNQSKMQARIQKILKSLEINYYPLSYRIRLELERHMRFCWTQAPLKKIGTEDEEGVSIVYGQNGKQIAVRMGPEVFVDGPLFNTLDETTKAYVVIHEVLHSFIPLDATRRNQKLRSFVKVIQQNELTPFSQEVLRLQAESNELSVPVIFYGKTGGICQVFYRKKYELEVKESELLGQERLLKVFSEELKQKRSSLLKSKINQPIATSFGFGLAGIGAFMVIFADKFPVPLKVGGVTVLSAIPVSIYWILERGIVLTEQDITNLLDAIQNLQESADALRSKVQADRLKLNEIGQNSQCLH